MSESPEEWFERMIIEGVIEFSGLNPDNGEMLYNFSKNLKNISPEIYQEMIDSMEKDIYKLWEKGFLAMDVTEENPLVKITAKSLDQDVIDQELDDKEKNSLEIIMMFMSKGNS